MDKGLKFDSLKLVSFIWLFRFFFTIVLPKITQKPPSIVEKRIHKERKWEGTCLPFVKIKLGLKVEEGLFQRTRTMIQEKWMCFLYRGRKFLEIYNPNLLGRRRGI